MFEHEEITILRRILSAIEEQTLVDVQILDYIKPRLTKIQIVWSTPMPLILKKAAPSMPLTLAPGQSSTGTIAGTDQFGNPFTIDFTQYKALWSDDNAAVASSTPSADNSSTVVAYVSTGVANVSVAVTRPDGTVINSGPDPVTCVPAPTPVLTAVSINFSTPTP